MKEIRTPTKVCVVEVRDENNNVDKSNFLDAFDRDAGYFQQVIRPMLSAGHENELVYWMRSFGLLPNTQLCKNSDSKENCNKMTWTTFTGQDMYQWKCLNCLEKRSIRDDSAFCDVKCSFKNAVRIILGWCRGDDFETMAAMLDIKKQVVSSLYNVASNLAEKYIKNNLSEFRIGGPGVVVLVDSYPSGCSNTNMLNRNHRPILCVSEIKSFPQKHWFELLDRNRTSNCVNQNKEKICNVIQEVVKPGSILVVPLESPLCSFYDIQSLRNVYPVIVTTDELTKHNTLCNIVEENLAVIWKNALDVCEEAQYYSNNHIQQFLISKMWQHKFANESFQMLLHQFSICQ